MKRFVFLLAVIVFVAVCSGIGAAQPSDVFTVVTSSQLKEMMDDGENDLVVVDTRSSDEYQEAHIKGAVSIPWAELSKDPAVLKFPKQSRMLFYCNGLA